MTRRLPTVRTYPTTCLSAHCGRTDCTGCRHLPTRLEFLAWVEETNAKQPDPVWAPTVWVAHLAEERAARTIADMDERQARREWIHPGEASVPETFEPWEDPA